MADLVITFPNAAIPRIQHAYAGLYPDGKGGVIWRDATAAEISAKLRDIVKAHVKLMETQPDAAVVVQKGTEIDAW